MFFGVGEKYGLIIRALRYENPTPDILGSPHPQGIGLQTCITWWRDLALTYLCGIDKKAKGLSPN
jgi:hypothetical protein